MKNLFKFMFIFVALQVTQMVKVNAIAIKELSVPSFSVSYINDYYNTYDCKYRMNFSDIAPKYKGTFDFVVTFSKLGGVKNIIVSQVSEMADWTYMDVGKLISKHSISNNIYYTTSRGYYCPELMTYVYEEKKSGSNGPVIGVFEVADYDYNKINSNKVGATLTVWYPLHNYNKIAYNCQFTSENECLKDKYCNWVMIDSGHKEYSCLEEKYSLNDDSSQIRTESCSGYVEKIFNQSIDYYFSLDGNLNVSIGGGKLGTFGSDNYVDKNNQLWDLWQNGQCCTQNKLGINYKNDSTILSCDGSDSTWEFEDDGSNGNNNYIEGDSQSGCNVIPPEIIKWITNALKFVRYVALTLVIVLGSLDFIKAAGSGEPDQMKKAGKSFMKRMIAVVILFLLPYFVDFILNMINIYGVEQNNIDCLK